METGCFSKSKSYVVRSDIKDREHTPWQKVLAIVMLLVFAVALVATLTLLLPNDETPNNTKTPSMTEIQTTSNTFLKPNHTIDSTLALEMSTTTNPISETTSDPTSTTEIQTTPFFFSEPNVTIGCRGKKFIVVFMKNIVSTTKRIFVTSENGVQMNISTSPNLDPC